MGIEKAVRALRRARSEGVRARGLYIDLCETPAPLFVDATVESETWHLLRDFPNTWKHAHAFFMRYRAAFDDLSLCSRVARLGGLRQLGVKSDPRSDCFIGAGTRHAQVISAPYLLDRRTHSVRVGAHMIACGLKIGFPVHDVAIAAFGGLLHDVGHPAYGHDGDKLLVRHGYSPHEERGQKLVMHDPEIAESCVMAGVEPSAIVTVMREEGPLGQLLNVMDTLAYVATDSTVVGIPIEEALPTRVFGSIVGVENDCLVVQDDAALAEILVARMTLSREIYYHPRNTIAAAALRQALSFAVAQGIISFAHIERGTDTLVELLLSEYVNRQRLLIPAWVHSAWILAHGFFNELERWEVHACATREEVARLLQRVSLHLIATAFVVEPHHYIAKTFVVRNSEGARYPITAGSEFLDGLPREPWYVLVWRG